MTVPNQKPEHTPTPCPNDKHSPLELRQEMLTCNQGHPLARFCCDPEYQRFICRAVNAYEKNIELIRWMAQTIHQAYHTDSPWTFRECRKSVCDAAAQAGAEAK